MNTKSRDPEKLTREWMNDSGMEKPSGNFTRLVMEKVEMKKHLYPYKKDNNLWHYILAVGLLLLYVGYRYFSGQQLLPAGIDLYNEIQPYIGMLQLLFERVAFDMTTPIVPLGIGAIVLLLTFDQFILRSLSFNR
jgi:hypothetical protein